MKVLLTGFGPFPGVAYNPSQAVVERLGRRQRYRGFDLYTRVLPTEYKVASFIINDAIRTVRPDICICLGVAEDPNLRLEAVARNRGYTNAPDNAGIVRTGMIQDDGPEIYRSTLPLNAIQDALQYHGFPVKFSYDAGGYVCNHIFYTARRVCDLLGLPSACGFIHIPPVMEVPEDGLLSALAWISDAIEIIVNTSVERAIAARRTSMRDF
jgi:pyroglutamyl-peptidase